MKSKIGLISLIMLIFVPTFGFNSMASNVLALGPAAILSWVVVALLYFFPLTIMFAEMGIANENKSSGIYAWVESSMGHKWAFVSTWSYYVADLFFLGYCFVGLPVMFSWMLFGGNRFGEFSTVLITGLGMLLVVLSTYIATRGVKFFTKISDIGGYLTVIATVLFVVFAIASVLFGKAPSASEFSVETMIPEFNSDYFSTFSWLLLAVAGAEVAGTYIRDVDNPKKTFPKGVIIATFLIAICYILGSLGVSFVASQETLAAAGLDDLNFIIYKILGDNWGISGKLVAQIYALIYTITSIAKYVVWMESPIRAMLSEVPERTFPAFLLKKQEDGTLVNALWLQCFIIIVMMTIPLVGSDGVNDFFIFLQNMTALSCVIPYGLVTLAYYSFRKNNKNPSYTLAKTRNQANLIFAVAFIMSVVAFVGAGWGDVAGSESSAEAISWAFQDYFGPVVMVLIGIVIARLTKLYYVRKDNSLNEKK